MEEARWRTHSSQRANPLGCEREKGLRWNRKRRDKIRFFWMCSRVITQHGVPCHIILRVSLWARYAVLCCFSLSASSVSPLPSSVLIFPLWNVESISGWWLLQHTSSSLLFHTASLPLNTPNTRQSKAELKKHVNGLVKSDTSLFVISTSNTFQTVERKSQADIV